MEKSQETNNVENHSIGQNWIKIFFTHISTQFDEIFQMVHILICFEEKKFWRYFATNMVEIFFLQNISIWVPFERSHQTELKYV